MPRHPALSALALATVLALVGTFAVSPAPHTAAARRHPGGVPLRGERRLLGSGRHRRAEPVSGVPRRGQSDGDPGIGCRRPGRRLDPGSAAARRRADDGPPGRGPVHPRLRLRPARDDRRGQPLPRPVRSALLPQPQRPGAPAAHGARHGRRPARARGRGGDPRTLCPGRPLRRRSGGAAVCQRVPGRGGGHGAAGLHPRGCLAPFPGGPDPGTVGGVRSAHRAPDQELLDAYPEAERWHTAPLADDATSGQVRQARRRPRCTRCRWSC